jgi:8-oxo-dGTP diphosphatase
MTENESLRPKVGVGVLIFNDKNEILIGKRKSAHGDGLYAPPGGHLEFGETFEECAKRETAEETGLGIKDIKFLTVTNDVFVSENKKHYITIIMTARADKGEPQNKEPEKCEKWEWVKWDEFPENLFLPVKNLRKQFNTIKP